MKNETTIEPIRESIPAQRGSGVDAGAGTTRQVSFIRKIVRLTFGRIGARLGASWVVLLALIAVFAPFLANSHPILMRDSAGWESPLLKNLTPADVVLQVTFWAFIILLFLRRWSLGKRAAVLAVLIAITTTVAIFAVHPPKPAVYEVYREGIKEGTITNVWYTPIHYSPDDNQRDVRGSRLQRPSRTHLLGTTEDAADLATNMIYASRIAMSIGFVATGVAVLVGVLMGGLMGYFAGWIDLIGMRIVEIFESIPTILLLMAFVSAFQSSPELAIYVMMVIIGVVNSFSYAEFVRAEFLSLRNRDFVHAAQAAGLPLRSILFRHMLPNGLTPVIVNASFGIANAILFESTLTFMGIGLQTEASWGSLLQQALGSGGTFFWWLALYPGLGIFLTVFSYNLMGESLRDALDPRLNKME